MKAKFTTLLLLLLTGCSDAHSAPVPEVRRQLPEVRSPASALSPQPSGSTISLTWDASPAAIVGYRVYASTNSDGPWRQIASVMNVTSILASGIFVPQWFAVTCFDSEGRESDMSNKLGILGTETRGVIWMQSADTPAAAWTTFPVPVFDGVLSNGSQVYRLDIRRTNQWHKESLP